MLPRRCAMIKATHSKGREDDCLGVPQHRSWPVLSFRRNVNGCLFIVIRRAPNNLALTNVIHKLQMPRRYLGTTRVTNSWGCRFYIKAVLGPIRIKVSMSPGMFLIDKNILFCAALCGRLQLFPWYYYRSCTIILTCKIVRRKSLEWSSRCGIYRKAD